MAIRWSSNDKRFGPFTFAKSDTFKQFALILGSGSADYPGCRLRLTLWKYTFIVQLPQLIKPSEDDEREYGASVNNGYYQIMYGLQTDDSETEQRKGWFSPFRGIRRVRVTYFNPNGTVFGQIFPSSGQPTWRLMMEASDAVPKQTFRFLDYDGEEIDAVVYAEEVEWAKGEGKFKWLSWFTKNRVNKSLSIDFSKEVGPEKGSWKGGTVGHSISMLPNETYEQAFRRYCVEQKLTFKEI